MICILQSNDLAAKRWRSRGCLLYRYVRWKKRKRGLKRLFAPRHSGKVTRGFWSVQYVKDGQDQRSEERFPLIYPIEEAM